jgi:hypothetical protein
MNVANLLPFKFLKRDENDISVFKALTPGDDLHTDEQGRHLIFRTINGRVRPMRVGAEDFAEWLVNQGVSINPADQKTLRELDKELEIMERAAEYGGPALQKQYENYFNERRQAYAQIAQGYYSQALQNQAKANNMTVENLQKVKQGFVERTKDESALRRESMELRGWDSSFHMWVEGQDAVNKLTPADDSWYYNRVYGILLSALIEPARRGIPLSQVDMNNVFSDEFIHAAMKLHYGEFFGNTGADPKKIIGAVRSMQINFRENLRDNTKVMTNFVNYWYDRMQKDFAKEKELSLESSPVTEGIAETVEGVIPEALPEVYGVAESKALLGLYNKAKGSKLHAAHRVMLHSMGRLIDSIPMQERVSAAVELSNEKRGLHSVHREGYKRAYTDGVSLGVVHDRDTLLSEALKIAESSSGGSTADKISALKRMSMIMGILDGSDVISRNPGIQEYAFNRKWNNSAINAHRVKSDGPGILDVILDDDKREAHTYTNQDLKIIHAPGEKSVNDEEVKASSSKKLDLGDGFTFSGDKMVTPDGYTVKFSPSSQGYATATFRGEDDSTSFEARVYMPPIGLSKMSEEDKVRYLDSLKSQMTFIIDDFKKRSSARRASEPALPEDIGIEGASFRVPVFDFKENLRHEDREFLGNVGKLMDEGNIQVEKVGEGIFIVKNPANNKTFNILMSKSKKQLVGMQMSDSGEPIPFERLSIEDLMTAIGYRSG